VDPISWACISCPFNTTTLGSGATTLVECAICINGNYGTGPSSCKACPANKAVPFGQVRPTSTNDCFCLPGFYNYNGAQNGC
jgi:hypothetical protein